MILTSLFATHSGILTSLQSTTAYAMTSTRKERSPTTATKVAIQSFGDWLEPPYIIGAKSHSTSKLLRTS